MLEKTFGSDDEAPINVKPKAERARRHPNLKLKLELNPYLKTWREYMTRMKMSTFAFLKGASSLVPRTKTKDNTKDISKPKPEPQSKPKDNIYTRIQVNAKKVIQNLEIK